MENRKFIIFLLLGLLLLGHQHTNAYQTDTHEYLSQESVYLYNQLYKGNLGTELVPFLLDGARREDDPPRWMNHFYDPIHEQGLYRNTAIDPAYTLGTWQTAKAWAQDEINQKKLKYSPIIASILSLFDRGKIESVLQTSNFTWNEALRRYIQGDKAGALFALGHIIHLIQDMSVPDHTRNDSHANGSPYETYAGQFTRTNIDQTLKKRIQTLNPLYKDSLDEYFTELALYSNNNFYSKDTIGIQSGYTNPEPDYFQKEGKFYYGFKNINGETIKIVAKSGSLSNAFSYIESNNNITIDEDDRSNKINNDYWSLLSKKAVQYSAGVLDLFFKEVHAHENDPEFITPKKQESLLGQVISLAQTTISKIGTFISSWLKKDVNEDQDMQEVQFIKTPKLYTTPENKPDKKEQKNETRVENETIKKQNIENQKEEMLIIKEQEEHTPTTTEQEKKQKQTYTPCPIPHQKQITQSSIIFNEIAWMGTTIDTNHEWIELKNTTSNGISIQGWSLQNESGSIHAVVEKPHTIPANGFYVLGRKSDTHEIAYNTIYTGALKNSNEELFLFNASCTLIDSVSGKPSWPAGINTQKRTMERNGSGNGWHTASNINGTPHKENSKPYEDIKIVGGTVAHEEKHTITIPIGTVRINEIMYNPIGNDTKHEWIEIYNTSSTSFDLTSLWRIREGTAQHFIKDFGTTTLQGNAYAIIADDAQTFLADFPTTTAPVFESSLSLNNTEETLTLVYNDTTIHTVSYTSEIGAQGDGNSLQYISETDTWSGRTPTPGTQNTLAISHEQDTSTTTPQATTTPIETSTTTQTEEPQQFIPVGQHALISEIYPDKTGNNEDFIEIYNPTDVTIALADYKLKIIKDTATTVSSLATLKDSEIKEIPPHGYYLIGFDEYASSTLHNADVTRGTSLPSTKSATIILLYSSSELENDIIIDEVTYDPRILEKGQSFERKAWTNGYCVSPSSAYEFGGNGCDVGSSQSFVIRNTKKSQNTHSLVEPRQQPTPPHNFVASYDQMNVHIHASWNGTTSSSTYFEYALTQGTSTPMYTTTTATTSTMRIDEVHTTYIAHVRTIDQDGYASEEQTQTIYVPSFLTDVQFYNNTGPVIDLLYDTYPFFPHIYTDMISDTNNRVIAFHYNATPTKTSFIHNIHLLDGTIGIESGFGTSLLPISYRNARGWETKNFLVLRSPWELRDISLADEYITATTTHIVLYPTDELPVFDESSYITLAFYDYLSINSSNNRTFQLVAVDNTKYYFNSETPTQTLMRFSLEPETQTETSTKQQTQESSSTAPMIETPTLSSTTATEQTPTTTETTMIETVLEHTTSTSESTSTPQTTTTPEIILIETHTTTSQEISTTTSK